QRAGRRGRRPGRLGVQRGGRHLDHGERGHRAARGDLRPHAAGPQGRPRAGRRGAHGRQHRRDQGRRRLGAHRPAARRARGAVQVGRHRAGVGLLRKDLSTAVAAVVGSLPGFTLPFVAALVLAPEDSDLLLLAVSVAVTVAVIVSSAVELTTIAEYGRVLGREQDPAPGALREYRRRILLFATGLTALVVPALGIAYAAGSPAAGDFVVLVCAVAPAPVFAAVASMLSGECIARGAPTVPIMVQAMRTLMPAVLLAVWWDAPLVAVAAMLPAGEAARAAILAVTARRLRAEQAGAADGALTPFGLVAQASSSGVTQLGPAVDRLFLSSSGAGAISSYEIADRLMYAGAQFVNMAFLVRRVG